MRRVYPFYQVDAFADRPLHGNPCAVIMNADDLSDDEMLAIAREMNLSETAFVLRSDIADFRARYFTPAEEIPLAGHPTLATTHALAEAGLLRLRDGANVMRLELKAGVVSVEIVASGGLPTFITMAQLKPRFLNTYSAEEILPVFGLTPEDALPGVPIQTVSTGTPQLMVPLRSLEALRRAQVDVGAYTQLRARADFFSPHLFCMQGISEQGQTFARHFGLPPDTPEDPFTGSATGGMGAYVWRYGLISEPRFVAEQGHWMQRPGEGIVELIGSREDSEAVKVGGATALIMRGELFI